MPAQPWSPPSNAPRRGSGAAAERLEPSPDHLVELAGGAERLGHEVAERIALHGQQGRGLRGLDRRLARGVAQNGYLSEELARPQSGDVPIAFRRALDLDLAVRDDEELVRRPSLARDHLALLRLRDVERGDDAVHLLGRQVLEDAVGALAVELRAELARG